MIPTEQTRSKLVIFFLLITSFGMAQPKWSFHLGSGFYQPTLGSLDPDNNSVIPSMSAFGKNILIDWGVKYQFYPNARVGYSRSNSYHTGNIGDSDYVQLWYRVALAFKPCHLIWKN